MGAGDNFKPGAGDGDSRMRAFEPATSAGPVPVIS